MAAQTQGIQQLLAAEKRAAEKVNIMVELISIGSINNHANIISLIWWGSINLMINFQVAEARKRKARRLKQAKEEANNEIDKFKNEREAAFKEYERQHMGSRWVVSYLIQLL